MIGIGFFSAVFNFCLLVLLLYLILRLPAKNYFYARRLDMKKKMVSSAWEIRRARIRYREGKRKFDGLEEDVGSRRKSVEKGCLEECNAILEEAMKQKEHIMEGARRRVRDERMRAVKLVRGRLLADAFRRVRRKLEMGVDADVRRSCLNHGLSELSRDLASGGASKIRERVGTGLG